MHQGVHRWQYDERGHGCEEQAADDRSAQRSSLRPLACADCERDHARDHRRRRHQNGSQAALATVDGRVVNRRAFAPSIFRKRHQKNRVRDGDANRHDRPHERLHVQRRSRDEQHQEHATNDRRHRGNHSERQAKRLEVRGQQQKDDENREQEAAAQAGERFFECRHLAAVEHRDAARRRSHPRDRLADVSDHGTERLPMDVGGEADHALHVVPIDFTGCGSVVDGGHVRDQRPPETAGGGA